MREVFISDAVPAGHQQHTALLLHCRGYGMDFLTVPAVPAGILAGGAEDRMMALQSIDRTALIKSHAPSRHRTEPLTLADGNHLQLTGNVR